MLEDDNQNEGNSSESNNNPPPTSVRDTNDTQIKTGDDALSTK